MVFVGSFQTRDNESVSSSVAANALKKEGVKIVTVAVGDKVDVAEMLPIPSDVNHVFRQDAVEPLKAAVKNAALPSINRGFPGKMT